MSDDGEPDFASGLDLATVSQRLAKERASNSIRIRRTHFSQPNRASTVLQASATPEDQLAVVAAEAETKFSPETIVQTFQSGNVSLMESLCVELSQFISSHPEITTINDPDIIELIVSSASTFNTPSSVSNYLSLIAVLAPKHESDLFGDLFFILRDEVFPNFPLEVCTFCSIIPGISAEAKNSMYCLGIINSLIEAYSQTEDEALGLVITSAIHATLAASTPDDADSIRELLPDLVTMLSNTSNEDSTNNILLSLVEVLAISATFISPMFKLNVHTIIAELITNPKLTSPCIAIAGNMAICSDDEIQKMMPIFEFEKSLIGSDFTGDVFWCLMNGLDSCPLAMMPFFDLSFIETMAELLQDSPFGILRDVACFAATLIVLAPADELMVVISHNVLGPLIDMLDCGNPSIILRCLDGLKKVVMLAFSDPNVIEQAPDLFQNDEVPEVLSRLQQCDEQMIISRAAQLESDINQLTS